MADHNKPTTTSGYANFVSELDARMDDLATGMDPAVSTVTNQPVNSIRWTSAAKKWQKWNGTSWIDLADAYAISITGNAATASSAAQLTTARTINGVSFNGTANITVTANTSAALTFNNGGSGVASGTTFNGSAARTISYNTVGAPSTTGAGASGTWGIAISGNAATATSATSATTAVNCSRSVVAGNGLTGGGALTANATVTLGTPGAITASSTDSVTANSHTHSLSAGTYGISISGNAATASAVANTLTNGAYLTGSNYNGSAATTWAVDATNLNTASKVVARDASGNFAAGTITAALSGNATTSTTAANCSRSVVAGNGLTGGGALTSNATLTLGTPGTLSGTTTNGVTTTSHTHALAAASETASGVVELANAAEVAGLADATRAIPPAHLEAGVKAVLDASGAPPVFGARAFVNFDGSGGIPSIRAGKNVSSVTYFGGGGYDVNMSVAMPDTNYTVIESASSHYGVRSGGSAIHSHGVSEVPPSTTAFRIQAIDVSNTPYTPKYFSAAVFR